MRIRLFHKLFITFAITSLASIVLFVVLMHVYFNRSFLNYLNEARDQYQQQLAQEIAQFHARHGSFERLANSRRAWRQLMRRALAPETADANGEHGEPRPPPPHERGGLRDPRRGPPPGGIPGAPWLPGPKPGGHFTLYAADQAPLVGRLPFGESVNTLPIRAGDDIVGYLGAPRMRRPASPRDVAFADRQYRVLLLAAAVAGLLSVIAAWFAARRMAQPIKALGSGTRALTAGDYEMRLGGSGDDELGQLTDDFNVLARTLQQHETTRQRWFADISHELRTPIAILRGELEAAIDGVRPNDRRMLDSLAHETACLERLINDLYDYARADLGTLDYRFEEHALEDIVTECTTHFEARFADAGLELRTALTPVGSFSLDHVRVTQMIQNILENCCRYVRAPGTVTVSLDDSAGGAQLVFEDTGPGVTDAQLANIFEPLSRGDSSRNRESGGSGLGLAICRRIAAAHGARIEAAHAAAGGLSITITFAGRRSA